jgi:hypothetical protein
VILFRCLAWDKAASSRARGGPLWFPRMLQGNGRHDNPELYGCLYVSVEPVSSVAEQLQRLAGTSLDDPAVLMGEGLRPSRIATNDRSVTQAGAGEIHARHAQAVGLRWWSTIEALWPNVTLFDRAEELLAVEDVHPLELGDGIVVEAADYLGLPIVDLT